MPRKRSEEWACEWCPAKAEKDPLFVAKGPDGWILIQAFSSFDLITPESERAFCPKCAPDYDKAMELFKNRPHVREVLELDTL